MATDEKPILDPERELPRPHDMLIEAEERDGIPTTSPNKALSPQSPTHKRSFLFWLLPLLVVLLLVAAGGVYFLSQQRPKEQPVTKKKIQNPRFTPSPTVIPVDADGWKIFSNATHNVFFHYPPEWEMKIDEFEEKKPEKVHIAWLVEPEPFGYALHVDYYEHLASISAKTFIKEYFYGKDGGRDANGKPFPDSDLKFTKKTINGNSVTIIDGLQNIPGYLGLGAWIQFKENALFMLISPPSIERNVTPEMFLELFEKILSTVTDTPDEITSPTRSQVVCTMDAKLCPDGSSVGRTGPNCEFAACPGE